MEEDEFGDLYTDVLSSFPPSGPSPQPPSDADSPNSIFTTSQNPQPPPLLEVENTNLILIQQEEEEEEEEEDSRVLIPGLHASATPTINDNTDSSSDSDDDLKIVLNETDPLPILHDGDAHDDHNPLIILADDTAAAAADDPDWGDDPAALGKDPSDAAAKPPNAPAHPRTNYPPYHSFHSQFKYVRPGAELLPTAPPGNVRPPVSISLLAGRGRGDLRPPGLKGPPLNKGFHPSFWAGSAPPRGLEFTLPSHKSIFDVDIDNFEEKPWKYPTVDVSDFFNFSLNEESWKDYCKQLEQLRLESTMQSKIRVYESGRAEQEFDPDLPPELAAAAAINDSLAENTDVAKGDGGLGDPAKGASRRPLLPTGRAIQVETGYGERLPSADTRPPRVRDSDAVIEIVLQDSVDDESTGNSDIANPDNDSGREDEHVGVVNEDNPVGEDNDFDGYPHSHRDVTIEDVTRQRSPHMSSPHSDVHDKERERSSPERASSNHHSGSKVHDSTENVSSPSKKRWTKETAHEIPPHKSSDDSSHERRSFGSQKEDSADSMEEKRSTESLSIACVGGSVEASVEGKMADDIATDNKSRKGKEDSDVVGSIEASNNKRRIHSTKQQKLSRPSEPSASKDVDDGDDVDSSRRNGTSKTTANCRDHQKWREGIEEETKQNGRPVYMGDVKRHRGGEHDSRKKDFDGRMDVDMDYVSTKGREDYYCHKEWDPSTGNHFHVKPDDVDWRRDRDYSEARWQRRDEDPHGRRTKAEDSRKQDRGDEIVSRHRRKVNEIGRSDKDEYLQPPKNLENGSWRSYHEKDAGLRYREKDDVSKSRHEILDDHHSKRRKDDDFMRRDHVDNQDTSFGVRESSSTHGKRDKEGVLNQRKRDDHPRVRDSYENHHAVRLKDEVWMQRERAEQQRDRDEWYRSKQSYEENLSRKDRGEGHVITRNSRSVKEKVLAGHSHGREEYKSHDKDAERHSEQHKRRERLEEETSLQHRGSEGVYARGNQTVNEGKRPRQDKSASRNDRVVSASDNQKFLQEKLRDKFKKTKESEGHSISGTSKRHQGEKDVTNDTADVKGLSEKAVAENDTSLHNLSREGVSSDDEQQDSRRGRSKLERWTSHKDGDRDSRSKSSSLKIKEMSKNRIASGSTIVVREESEKNDEMKDSNQCLAVVKESGGGSEMKDVDAKATNYRREDTVEKLKKRRERFKLQLASEKDPSAIKKLENESIPSSHNESPVNAEVKQERPPRKRRWLSS